MSSSFEKLKDLRWTPETSDPAYAHDLRWHRAAVDLPRGIERPIVRGIEMWLAYASSYPFEFEQEDDHRRPQIEDDGVFAPEWEAWGKALHGLLGGPTGRLNCGVLSTIILDNLSRRGFKE